MTGWPRCTGLFTATDLGQVSSFVAVVTHLVFVPTAFGEMAVHATPITGLLTVT